MSLAAVLTKANSSQKGKELKQRKGQLHDQRVSAVKLILVPANIIQCNIVQIQFAHPANGYIPPATTILEKKRCFSYSNCVYFCGIIEKKQ